jgi:N-acyl-D-aspartate/D-glutamate deacylase
MSGFWDALRCAVAGDCAAATRPEQAQRTIDETCRRLDAIEEELAPVRRRVEAEARARPDFAEALQEARRNLNVPLNGKGRS